MGLDVTGGVTGDLTTFNNSAGGYVQAGGDITHNIIGFGGGVGDVVLAENANISNNIVVFGTTVVATMSLTTGRCRQQCDHLWQRQ